MRQRRSKSSATLASLARLDGNQPNIPTASATVWAGVRPHRDLEATGNRRWPVGQRLNIPKVDGRIQSTKQACEGFDARNVHVQRTSDPDFIHAIFSARMIMK